MDPMFKETRSTGYEFIWSAEPEGNMVAMMENGAPANSNTV